MAQLQVSYVPMLRGGSAFRLMLVAQCLCCVAAAQAAPAGSEALPAWAARVEEQVALGDRALQRVDIRYSYERTLSDTGARSAEMRALASETRRYVAQGGQLPAGATMEDVAQLEAAAEKTAAEEGTPSREQGHVILLHDGRWEYSCVMLRKRRSDGNAYYERGRWDGQRYFALSGRLPADARAEIKPGALPDLRDAVGTISAGESHWGDTAIVPWMAGRPWGPTLFAGLHESHRVTVAETPSGSPEAIMQLRWFVGTKADRGPKLSYRSIEVDLAKVPLPIQWDVGACEPGSGTAVGQLLPHAKARVAGGWQELADGIYMARSIVVEHWTARAEIRPGIPIEENRAKPCHCSTEEFKVTDFAIEPAGKVQFDEWKWPAGIEVDDGIAGEGYLSGGLLESFREDVLPQAKRGSGK